MQNRISALAITSLALAVLCVCTVIFWNGVPAVISQTLKKTAQKLSRSTVSKNKPELPKESSAFQGEKRTSARPIRSQTFNQTFSALSAEASQTGSVPVIVKLNVTFVPEGHLGSDANRLAQRNAIRQSQDTLLSQLQAYNPQNIKKYEYVPYLGVTLDSSGLTVLQSSSQVVEISDDEEMTPATSQSLPLIGTDIAHNQLGFTGVGQTIAILDTGVDKSHSEFAGKIVSEACYSTNNATRATTSLCPNGVPSTVEENSGVHCSYGQPCYHGTRVAGIAAGKSGVAKDSKIISIQVNSLMNGSTVVAIPTDVVKGLERVYALALKEIELTNGSHSIAAVNVSAAIGSTKYTASCNNIGAGGMTAAILNLRSIGIATVIASGNNANFTGSFLNGLSYPACISEAISVGATGDGSGTTSLDAIWPDSQSSQFLHLLAPGDSITSPVPGDIFTPYPGTSLAAAHVTGAWALLKQQQKQQQPNFPATNVVGEILKRLQNNGVPITDTRNNVTKSRIKIDSALGCLRNVQPDKWKGEYFNSDNLTGDPVMVRDDTTVGGSPYLDMDFGINSPSSPCEVNTDNFSVRWTRKINLSANLYRFNINADDGFRLFIDDMNNPVLDHWNETARTKSVVVPLKTGEHHIKLEFREQTEGAYASLSWTLATDRWAGHYFNNADLLGSPAMVRDDGTGFLPFDWGSGSPSTEVNADNFSARWTRTIYFPADLYRFNVYADDGVRLYIDGVLRIDHWDITAGARNVVVPLKAGNHEIKLEYREWGGLALAKLDWSVASDKWKGEYYNGTNLSGDLAMIRDDGDGIISFDWGGGSPSPIGEVGADNFSARWTRTINFPAGIYKFTATGDNGIRLYVDDGLKIDRWSDTVGTNESPEMHLNGNHRIRFEFFENVGGAVAELKWELRPPCVNSVASNRWRGEYFNNANLSGGPAMVQDDGNGFINFNWGDGGPRSICGFGGDYFSARWTLQEYFPYGFYRFTLSGDNGVRLYVDGQLKIDRWTNTVETSKVDIRLEGYHEIRLEYFETWGGAAVNLSWDIHGANYCLNPIPEIPGNKWKAEYFDNTSFAGYPVMVRADGTADSYNTRLEMLFNTYSPNSGCMGSDNFSVRWTANIDMPADDEYGYWYLAILVDDSVRVYVDDALVFTGNINWWTGIWHEIQVPAGMHKITIEYIEHQAEAFIRAGIYYQSYNQSPCSGGEEWCEYSQSCVSPGYCYVLEAKNQSNSSGLKLTRRLNGGSQASSGNLIWNTLFGLPKIANFDRYTYNLPDRNSRVSYSVTNTESINNLFDAIFYPIAKPDKTIINIIPDASLISKKSEWNTGLIASLR